MEQSFCKGDVMKERTEISMQLYQMMVERGYPENLCKLFRGFKNNESGGALWHTVN